MSRPQGLRGFGDGLNLLEGASATRVPYVAAAPHAEEVAKSDVGTVASGPSHDKASGAQARTPAGTQSGQPFPPDCNGKPLTYIPIRQLGRCWFDKTPHVLNDWCFRWYVLRDGEASNG